MAPRLRQTYLPITQNDPDTACPPTEGERIGWEKAKNIGVLQKYSSFPSGFR
jgi:hypothetical protein